MEKTTGLYILGGITLALVGAIAVYEYRKRDQATTIANQQLPDSTGTPAAMQKFRGFNFDTILNSKTKRAFPEITALQRMINAYYDGAETINVTGSFDAQTKDAVMDIVNKSSTSLGEFSEQFLTKKRGQKVTTDLITSMTITGR